MKYISTQTILWALGERADCPQESETNGPRLWGMENMIITKLSVAAASVATSLSLALLGVFPSPSLAQRMAAIPQSAAMPPGLTYHAEDPYPNYKRARYMACRDSVFQEDPFDSSGDPGRRRETQCFVSDNPVKYSAADELYNPVTHFEDETGVVRERGPSTPEHFPVNILIAQHGYGGIAFFYCDDTSDFETISGTTCDLNEPVLRVVPTGYGALDYYKNGNYKNMERRFHRTGAYNNWGYQDSDNDGFNDDYRNISLIPYLEEKIPDFPSDGEVFNSTAAYYSGHPDDQSGYDKRHWVVLPITLDINPGAAYVGLDDLPFPTGHNERGLATVHNGLRLRHLMDNLWTFYKPWINTVSFIGHSTGAPVIKSMLQQRDTLEEQKRYLNAHEWIRYTDDMIGIAPGYGGTPTVFCDPSNDDLKVTLGGGILDERDFEGWFDGDEDRYWTPSDLLINGEEKRTAAWPNHMNILSIVGVFRHPDGLYGQVPVIGPIACPELENEESTGKRGDSWINSADGNPLGGWVRSRAPTGHGTDVWQNEEWWVLGKFDGGMGSFSAFEGTMYCKRTLFHCDYVRQTTIPSVIYNNKEIHFGTDKLNPVIGNRDWVLAEGLHAKSRPRQGDGYMKRYVLDRINREIPVYSRRAGDGRRKANIYVEVGGASHLGLLHNEGVLYLAKRWLANSTTTPHFRTVSSKIYEIDHKVFSYDWGVQRQLDPDGPWTHTQYQISALHGANTIGSLGPLKGATIALNPVGGAQARTTRRTVELCLDFQSNGSCTNVLGMRVIERGLFLPGTPDSYATVTNLSHLLWGGAEFTWAIKVKINVRASSRAEGIISHGTGWKGTGAYLILKNGRLHFVTKDRVVADSQAFPSGRWVTVVATKDRFGSMRIYIDGESRGSRYGGGTIICDPTLNCVDALRPNGSWDVSKRPLDSDPFYIGALIDETNGLPGFFLDGEVKALEILSKALTEEEVRSFHF